MEKLSQETVNFTEKNIDRIAALFPSVITETKDADGKLKRAVNFDQLKQLLSDEVVDGDECYEFTWVGKKQSIIEGNRPIRKTLRPSKEESKNWDSTENLYIEGDNLDVLKLLQNSYLNKVKMIYIDPPYNTGNDFIYRDNFKVSKEDYEEELGLFDEEENRLFKNTETNGRYHSDWCSMMYPRLQLARNLLTDDGVIFISIDDNEVHNLRKICDEVFGEENFVAQLTVLSNPKGRSQDKFFATNHEYVIIYSKKILEKGAFAVSKSKIQILQDYPEQDNQGYFRLLELRNTHRDFGLHNRKNLYYPIYVNTETLDVSLDMNDKYNYEIYPIWDDGFKGCWTWSKEKSIKENHLLTARLVNGKYKIYRKSYGEGATMMLKTILNDKDFFTEKGQLLFNVLFNTKDKIFQSPKSVDLLKILINTMGSGNEIILDFFSGSATTAHAVMQLNAEDGGNRNRKFIMVQLPEETDPKSEAYKAGYKNICEIGKERIRRAGKKIEEELKAKSTKGDLFEGDKEVKMVDTGFRVLKVDSTNMKDVYYSPSQYNQQMLLDLESNIKDDRTDIDLLYGVLLDWGVPLSLPHITEKIGGKDVHFVNDTDLVACFEEHVPEEVIREIARRKPLRVVFRDSSFRNSPDKINVTEIFKTLSPETTIKVI
jgi:adenine-specific DNA-methyltransferase